MACTFIEGRYTACRDGIPGIDKIYLTEFGNITQTSGYTIVSGTITAMTQAASTKFWAFDMEQENASYTESFTGSTDTWNGFYAQSLVWNQYSMSAKNRNLLATMVQARLMAIAKMVDGSYFVIGLTRSSMVSTIAAQTGKKLGEMNGYVITMTGNEPLGATPMSAACFATLSIGQ